MIYLEDLRKAKEQNEQTIQANNELIIVKQKENCELEAENRVFDKLIAIESEKEYCCATEENIEETEQQSEL